MSLDGGSKPEYPRGTYADMGKTCKQIDPGPGLNFGPCFLRLNVKSIGQARCCGWGQWLKLWEKKKVRGGHSEKQSQSLAHVKAKQRPAVTGRCEMFQRRITVHTPSRHLVEHTKNRHSRLKNFKQWVQRNEMWRLQIWVLCALIE